MNAVFLDLETLEDIDLNPIKQQVSGLKIYHYTEPSEAVQRAKDFDIIIVNKTMLNRSILNALPKLKLICVAATGYNNIDVDALKELNIALYNCQSYANQSVTQHVITLILVLHNSLLSYTKAVESGQWHQSQQFALVKYPFIEITGRKLGIIGYGNLGKSVANAAKSLGMEVLIANRVGKKQPGRMDLDELLSKVDVLSLHCPLTNETNNLINKHNIKLMKKGAMIINCARGGIVNEADVVTALKSRHLAGVAFDVLTKEPPDKDNFLLKQNLDNLIITPHCSWASTHARECLIQQITENINAFQQNNKFRRINC